MIHRFDEAEFIFRPISNTSVKLEVISQVYGRGFKFHFLTSLFPALRYARSQWAGTLDASWALLSWHLTLEKRERVGERNDFYFFADNTLQQPLSESKTLSGFEHLFSILFFCYILFHASQLLCVCVCVGSPYRNISNGIGVISLKWSPAAFVQWLPPFPVCISRDAHFL